MACPYTYNFVYLTDEVKKMIAAEKKPKLYEQVMAGDDKEHIKKIENQRKSGFLRLPAETVQKVVHNGFTIVYQDKFNLTVDHL